MTTEDSEGRVSDEDASVEDLIEQSRALISKARETLERAEVSVARAQANRREALMSFTGRQDRSALMLSLRTMQGTRTELVTTIQQTTQAMHLATRYVQMREKFIQAHVEWSRQHGQ